MAVLLYIANLICQGGRLFCVYGNHSVTTILGLYYPPTHPQYYYIVLVF